MSRQNHLVIRLAPYIVLSSSQRRYDLGIKGQWCRSSQLKKRDEKTTPALEYPSSRYLKSDRATNTDEHPIF